MTLISYPVVSILLAIAGILTAGGLIAPPPRGGRGLFFAAVVLYVIALVFALVIALR